MLMHLARTWVMYNAVVAIDDVDLAVLFQHYPMLSPRESFLQVSIRLFAPFAESWLIIHDADGSSSWSLVQALAHRRMTL